MKPARQVVQEVELPDAYVPGRHRTGSEEAAAQE